MPDKSGSMSGSMSRQAGCSEEMPGAETEIGRYAGKDRGYRHAGQVVMP